jgi:phospholipase/carboxylesterase
MRLTGPLKHAKQKPVKGVVVFVHGLGDSGEGISQIERYLRPFIEKSLREHIAFAAPNAPFSVTNDPWDWLEIGHAWFRIDWDETNNVRTPHPEDWQQSGADLAAYLQELATSQGVELDKVVLVGFSQGAMMSLYTIPHLPQGLAGVAALAGRVLEPEALQNSAHKPPVMLVHGTLDDVVPPHNSEQAYALLKQAGFQVEHHPIAGSGHGDLFTEETLHLLAEFIAGILTENK